MKIPRFNIRGTVWPLRLLLLVLILPFALRAEVVPLIDFGGTWAYYDQGREPAPNWSHLNFDDGDWSLGVGQFGYGDGDEQTVVGFGPNDERKFITTYFRTYVTLDNPYDYSGFTLNLRRDDGVVVHVNGLEVFRDNLPSGPIEYSTLARQTLFAAEENQILSATLPPAVFEPGANVIAVEIHQAEPASSDLSFDLQLLGNLEPSGLGVIRGPYLQVATSSNIIVRWRTVQACGTGVRYGTNIGQLEQSVFNQTPTTEHEITLTNLRPETLYYYSIGTETRMLAGDRACRFRTAPAPGSTRPTRIWATGDFGTGYPAQMEVRNAFQNFTTSRPADLWLMLGDNAYGQGFDHEYQARVFEVYSTLLRQLPVWPTIGNHETGFGSEELTDNYDYYRIFTMPTNAQGGGLPSGTEHYYSFDHANIHFICLDSMTAVFRQPGSAMLRWLEADLADTSQDWIIVFYHHPAYTKGSHDSDFEQDLIEMRENVVPILEAYGVDLVLSGHSHSYERSFLIQGHYGPSSSFGAANLVNSGDGRMDGNGPYRKPAGGLGAGQGLIHIVDGSSGGQYGGGDLDHPANFYSTLTAGSLILDVDGPRLDGTFLSESGTVDDYFTLLKDESAPQPRPILRQRQEGTNLVLSWPTSRPDFQLESSSSLTGNWSEWPFAATTNGRVKSVAVPNRDPVRFFQLRRTP